jgi:hypothetical protein
MLLDVLLSGWVVLFIITIRQLIYHVRYAWTKGKLDAERYTGKIFG